MPEDDDTKTPPFNPYVLGQLSRAITTAAEHKDAAVRQRSLQRIDRWTKVFQGMLDGTIAVGARAPVKDVPAWVTLEVVKGGFATGNLLAAGSLQPHELELLSHLNRPADETARAALNIYYLSDSGQQQLCEMMQSGRYRINVPEEGALLVIAWLLSHGMTEQAQELIDDITPFFDRLRFYPVPDQNPIVPSPTVHRQTVGETISALCEREPQAHVEAMVEALKIWQPLYDRTVAMFLETIEDGEYCRRFSVDWRVRANALLEEYASLRKVHTLCRKPDRPKENFTRLRGYLKLCAENPDQVTKREVGMIRHILGCYEKRHGAPGSEQFAQRRRAAAHIASLPTHSELVGVLLKRLEPFPVNAGIANLDAVVSPISNDESIEFNRFNIPVGSNIPESLVHKVRSCWDAPIEQLVEHRVVTSGDVLAQVLPQITSHVRAAGIVERDLRLLYSAIYSAFRRRRSLLLLDFDRQVRLEDLPWIAVLDSQRRDDLDAKEQARQTLEQVSTIALVSFPYAILPNKLLQELRALIAAAGLSTPIVDEIAADIFMGAFSDKFLRAAQIAAEMLNDTLYHRYYGLPYEWLRDIKSEKEYGEGVLQGYAELCEKLAHVDENEGWSVSRNGRIIEQSQILTTQNLAPLFVLLDLHTALQARLRTLAEHCFRWMTERQTSKSGLANLRMRKNSAYAWRQMVFFLSLLDSQTVQEFLLWARAHLEKQNASTRERLDPPLIGLEWIAAGGTFNKDGIGGITGEGRLFLGWTTTRN